MEDLKHIKRWDDLSQIQKDLVAHLFLNQKQKIASRHAGGIMKPPAFFEIPVLPEGLMANLAKQTAPISPDYLQTFPQCVFTLKVKGKEMDYVFSHIKQPKDGAIVYGIKK